MHDSHVWRAAALVAALVFAPAFGAGRTSPTLERLVPSQGLVPAQVEGLGLAYTQPGAALGSYDRILLEPVDVAFRRDWKPYRPGSSILRAGADREALRAEVAQWVHDAFAQTLQRGGRYRLVDQPGPGVLRVRLHVVDLYLNNPGLTMAGRSRTFAASSGEITMVAELSDAASGQVLARLADWEDMRHTGRLLPSSDVRTSGDVQEVASAWARSLNHAFLPARAAGQ
ncbi:MAG: DUF3313 family protein [Ramlibacter sp.]